MLLRLVNLLGVKLRMFGVYLGFRRYKIFSEYQCSAIDFALVVQGPYVKLGRFTFDMLKYYRDTFPNSVIIYSTTSELPKEDALLLEDKFKIDIVKPNCDIQPGPFNFNLQLLTTNAGLDRLSDYGERVNFVLKTRSDQVLLNGKFYEYFKMLLQHYPLIKNTKGQQGRLLFSSLNSFNSRLYGLSDMLVFGLKDDVISYFACEYDLRSTEQLSIAGSRSIKDHSTLEVCEVRLAVQFLKSKDEQLLYTIEDSKTKISSRFIVIDHEMIEQYWCKYSSNIDRYASFGKYEEMSYLDWLSVYNDPKT